MTNVHQARVAALACLVSCASWSFSAQAQYESLETTQDGYEVHFEDGDVLSESDQAKGFILRLPPEPRRVLLIRPRASFVSEMLKTVEHM